MSFAMELANTYKEMVKDGGPYAYFITITFSKNIGIRQSCTFTNRLLHHYNKEIFHWNYKKRGRFVDGFAFIERHRLGKSRCEFHIHMLVKTDERYKDFSLFQLDDILVESALKVVNDRDKQVFNKNCVDIKPVTYEDGIIKYCFKDVNDRNLDCIKSITKDGLADSLDLY